MKRFRKGISVFTLFLIIFSLAGCGLFRKFDAKEYTQAMLDLTFQGETETLAAIRTDKTEEELHALYLSQVQGFADQYIIGDLDVGDTNCLKFYELCTEIFKTMKYKVLEAEKKEKKQYQVQVEIQQVDIFPVFTEAVKADSEKIRQKALNGEYQGTEEEINAQMQSEFVNHSYELLWSAHQEMTYGEKETIILTVTGDDDNLYQIEDEDMVEMLEKILQIDEIQD